MITFLISLGILCTILIVAALILNFSIKFDENHNASFDSWHFKLYALLRFENKYYTNKPKTICLYFWNFLFYILIIPVTLPMIIIGFVAPKIRFEDGSNKGAIIAGGIFSWIAILLSFVAGIGILGYEDLKEFTPLQIFLSIITGIAAISSVLTIVGLSIYGITEYDSYIKIKNYNRPSKPDSMLKLRYKAWKNKNCPMINWD